jgi:hypothetical protein
LLVNYYNSSAELAENVKIGILVDFVDPKFAANQEFLWVMRPNVAQALEHIGWAPQVSHLLYPRDESEGTSDSSLAEDGRPTRPSS